MLIPYEKKKRKKEKAKGKRTHFYLPERDPNFFPHILIERDSIQFSNTPTTTTFSHPKTKPPSHPGG
jgi:hypothetical protein